MNNTKRRPSLTMAHAGRRAGAVGLLLALCLILVGVPALADEPPGTPHAFYGTVTVEGTLAAEGTAVQAYVDGELAAETTVDAQGEYDLSVPGTDGAEVTFRVAGVLADQTSTWVFGAITELNLTVGEVPDEYELTMAVSPMGGGTATDETDASPYLAGAEVEIRAVPAAGYEFVNWTAPAGSFTDSTDAETTFTMPAQTVTVTANFREEDTNDEVVGGTAYPVNRLTLVAAWIALAAVVAGAAMFARRRLTQG